MSFEIALSGINAINTSLDSISNNIANAGTFGFKGSRANFSSMYAGTQPVGTQIGSVTQSLDIGGGILTTGRGLDAAIQGRGFFVAKDQTGAEVYSRVGIFTTNKDGYLVDNFDRRIQGFGVVVDATGKPVPGAGLGALGDLKVPAGQLAAQATTSIDYVANLSSDWELPTVGTFDMNDPLSYNSSKVSVVYDSLGARHTLTQYFVKSTNTNEVVVNFAFDGVDLAQPATLTFDTAGKLTNVPPSATLAIPAPVGAEALTVDVNYTGTTQSAGETTNTVNNPNGYAAGTLIGVVLAEDGSVVAQYSNGAKQSVGTVALATFPNESELVAVGDTSWTSANESGAPLYGTPGTGLAGELAVGAIEQSNVDLTAELVNLMTSQRNYQANTKVISTENEMMQSLLQST
jgi:flagellar hook protein FlgE